MANLIENANSGENPRQEGGAIEDIAIIRNSAYNAVRLIVSWAAGLITSSVIARTLGPDAMGQYSYVFWITGILLAVAHGGIPSAMIRYIAETAGQQKWGTSLAVFKRLLFWQAALAVAVCAVASILIAEFRSNGMILYLGVAIVLPQILQHAITGAFTGLQQFDKIALLSSAGAAVNLIAILIAAGLHSGVVGMLIASGISAALSALVSLWVLGWTFTALHASPCQSATNEASDLHSIMRRVRSFSPTVWYMVLLDAVVWGRGEIYFLERYSAISEVAIYSIAFALMNKMWDAASSISSNFGPMAANAIGRSDPESIRKLLRQTVRYSNAFFLPACILAVGFSKPVILALYGKQYASVVPVMLILLAAPLISIIGEAAYAVIYAFERQKFVAIVLTPASLLNLPIAWLLVPRYGALGAACANMAAQFANRAFELWYAARIAHAKVSILSMARVWLLAVCCALPAIISCLYYDNMVITLALSTGGAIGFFGLLLKLNEFTLEEFRATLNLVRNSGCRRWLPARG